MTIYNFLTLSSGHLSEETWAWLDTQTSGPRVRAEGLRAQEIMAGRMRYGWFLYADEEPDLDTVPADLVTVFRHVRAQGCEYLLFDCDADPASNLPILHPGFMAYDQPA